MTIIFKSEKPDISFPLNKGLVSFANNINKYCLINNIDTKKFQYNIDFFKFLYMNSFQFEKIEFILIEIVKALSINLEKIKNENEKLNEINKCTEIIEYLYSKKCIQKNYLKQIVPLVKEFVDLNQWNIFKPLIKNTTPQIINKNRNNIIHYFITWVNELSLVIEEKKVKNNITNLNWGNAGLGKPNPQYLSNQLGLKQGGLVIITGVTRKGKTTYFKKCQEQSEDGMVFYITNSECKIHIEKEEICHTFLYEFWKYFEINFHYNKMIVLKNIHKQNPIELLDKNTPLALFLDRKIAFEDLNQKLLSKDGKIEKIKKTKL